MGVLCGYSSKFNIFIWMLCGRVCGYNLQPKLKDMSYDEIELHAQNIDLILGLIIYTIRRAFVSTQTEENLHFDLL